MNHSKFTVRLSYALVNPRMKHNPVNQPLMVYYFISPPSLIPLLRAKADRNHRCMLHADVGIARFTVITKTYKLVNGSTNVAFYQLSGHIYLTLLARDTMNIE